MSLAAKHRKQAAEFEQQKQFDRAIASYAAAIMESDAAREEIDVALFNRVGDLALRQGRIPEAMTYYERAVEQYIAGGRLNNAVALCNKILRTAPSRIHVHLIQGRICARKGLKSEASKNFLEYATRMQQEGRQEEAQRALAEVAALSPDIPEVQRLVAELGGGAGAAGYSRPATPTPAVAPAAFPAPLPPRSSPAGGKGADGLVFLDVDFRAKVPEGEDVLDVHVPTPVSSPIIPERPQPAQQESIGGSLDEHLLFDPSAGRTPSAVPTPPSGTAAARDQGSLTPPFQSALPDDAETGTPGPEDAAPLPLERGLADHAAPLFDEARVERLVDDSAWELPGLVVPLEGMEQEPALDAPPASLEALLVEESLADALDPLHQVPPVTPHLPTPRDLAIPGMAQALAAGERLVASAEARSVESVLAAAEAALAPPPPFRLDPHDFILPGELPPLILPDTVMDAGRDRRPPTTGEAVAEAEPLADPVAELTGAAPTGEAPGTPAAEVVLGSFWDAVEPPNGEPTEPAALPIPDPMAALQSQARSALERWEAEASRAPEDWGVRQRLAEARMDAGDTEGGIAALEQALDGLMRTGRLDRAADVAEVLVRVSPDRIPSHQRRLEVAIRRQDGPRLRTAYLDLADALMRHGDEGAARAVYARVLELDPTEQRARAAMGGDAAAAPVSAPVSTPPRTTGAVPTPVSVHATRIRVEEPEATGDETVDFEILLRRFKDGVARSLGDDDYGSRYDLGVAYKEMGLLDDAVAEFQKALRSPAHRLPAYEALGQCFVEQGRHQVAITLLSRALSDPELAGKDDRHRVGVLYLLAYANEALQRREEALTHFQHVHQIDRNFRDVAARLTALGRGPS